MSDTATIIGTIRKNAKEEIRVALDEYRGVQLCDLRVFASFDDGDAERKPTKKGIAFRVEQLPALIDALNDAAVEARRRGLIPA